MDQLICEFREAQVAGDGYRLSSTLSPLSSSQGSDQLRAFALSSNHASIKRDLEYLIMHDDSSPIKLDREEGLAWVDIYVAFWKAIGELLKIEDRQKSVSV